MKQKELPIAILRWGLALIFLYFGYQQLTTPDLWALYVPSFLQGSIITANNLVIMNAVLELTLGLFLAGGIYTRFSSLILSLHLFLIALSIGIEPVGVRDLGLTLATFVIYLYGIDEYTIDWNIKNRTNGFLGILK